MNNDDHPLVKLVTQRNKQRDENAHPKFIEKTSKEIAQMTVEVMENAMTLHENIQAGDKPLWQQEIVTCCGLYPNGDKKFNGVYEADLDHHIEYNKKYRFGRALFVRGKCVYEGCVSKELIEKTEIEIKDIKVLKHTRPYS